MAAAFCTFVRGDGLPWCGHDGKTPWDVVLRTFVAAVWLATLWACGYLPRLVSFFNMPASTATGRCCSPASTATGRCCSPA